MELTPFLTVKNARGIVEFYKKAFGMSLEGERFYAVDQNPAGFNQSPTTLGGTSVRMSLIVADPCAVADRAVAAGAKIVFPIADQPYGMRQGRIADPEGHHWLIGKPLR